MLTPLQNQILVLVLAGLTNREIALRLDTTPGSVGTQIGRIVMRFGLTRRSEIRAIANGSGHPSGLRTTIPGHTPALPDGAWRTMLDGGRWTD